MSKKFIQNIQKLIEEKDPKKDLGLVSEGNISHFQAKPPALAIPPGEAIEPASDPTDPTSNRRKRNILRNLVWTYSQYLHNRGQFEDLTLENFNTTIGRQSRSVATASGNLSLHIVGNNHNRSITTELDVSSPVTVVINPVVNNDISLAVYIAFESSAPIKVFSSGTQRYANSDINLNFDQKGTWTLTILLYQEKGDTTFELLGDLGSFVSGTSTNETDRSQPVTYNRSRGNQGFESVFVDGANGPTLSNIIYWNRFVSTAASGNDRVGGQSGYGLYNVINERLSFDVVSGWGTDAFVISGSQLDDFPIAGTLGIPGPIAVTYQISGSKFDLGADRTIVTVSGTNFLGAKFDPIYMERTIHLTDITQDSSIGSIISGTHFNVKSGDLYTYEVDTFNRFGNRGTRSIRISGTAGDITPPGLVTSLAGTGSLKAIRLTWTNPTNIDLKGIHIWDTDTVVSGTTKPIKTIIKGSNTTIPECTVVNEVSSGTLIDVWPYKLYASTYDHAGNESTEAMPTVTVTTDVEIKTSREGQRIETDTSTNALRFFDDNDIELVTIGENIVGSTDGLLIQSGSAIFADIFVDDNQSNPHNPISCNYEIRGNQNIFDGPGTQHRGAVAGTVFNRFVVNNSLGHNVRFAGVYGRAGTRGGGTPGTRVDLIGVHGDVDSALTGENVYAGYFTGNKVFVEKDLIVSGTTNLESSKFSGPNPLVDVTHPKYGAVADCIKGVDGAITNSDATFTSAAGAFVSGDIGKSITIQGAGASSAILKTTIASINSLTSVELTATASTTVSSKDFAYGTDSGAAIKSAYDSITNGGILFIPGGIYYFGSSLLFNLSNIIVKGTGRSSNTDFNTSNGGTELIKGFNGDGIQWTGQSGALENFDINCVANDSGDGISMEGGRSVLRSISTRMHKGDGVRIGKNSNNNNLWRMYDVHSHGNGGSGIYIHDDGGGAPDTNAGCAFGLDLRNNTGEGLKLENTIDNQFYGLHSASNTEFGIHMISGAKGNNFSFPYLEANTAGTGKFASGALENCVWGTRTGTDDAWTIGATSDDNILMGRDNSLNNMYTVAGNISFEQLHIADYGGSNSGLWNFQKNSSTRDLEIIKNATQNIKILIKAETSGTTGLTLEEGDLTLTLGDLIITAGLISLNGGNLDLDTNKKITWDANNNNALYRDGTVGTVALLSANNIALVMDSEANTSNAKVSFLKDTADPDTATEVASIDETGKLQLDGEAEIDGDLNHDGTNVGFYGTAPVAQQTGVAVTAAGIHAALVSLGLITA